jgi:hypothetical protein
MITNGWTSRDASTEVGVLNRNIAGSARLASQGTGPPGYIAWRAGTKSADLAQPCLKLRLLRSFAFICASSGRNKARIYTYHPPTLQGAALQHVVETWKQKVVNVGKNLHPRRLDYN